MKNLFSCRALPVVLAVFSTVAASSLPCALAAQTIAHGHDNVYQWVVDVTSARAAAEPGNPTRVFLWIPPSTLHVRGILLSGHNAMEEAILEDPVFRRGLAEMDFAIMWVTPGWEPSGVFYAGNGAQRAFEEACRKLADVSGFFEIEYAPVAYMSHSAQASSPYNFGAWNPDRALALISLHGDSPHSNLLCCDHINPYWADRNIDGIPALMSVGEYEWAEFRVESAYPFMRQYPGATLSMWCDAGHTHSDCSEQEMEYIMMFLRKAAASRTPASWVGTEPVKLTKLDKTRGWLADRWRMDAPPVSPAAPYNEYRGDRDSAFWYFDREMAEFTESYYARERGKLTSSLALVQGGKRVEKLRFTPDADGLTFHARVEFADEGHTSAPIQIRREHGPVRVINDTTFRVEFYRSGFRGYRTGDIMLHAYANADDTYKRTVMNLPLFIPHRLTRGAEQRIDFPQPADVHFGTREVTLTATSTSGLPVSYYVDGGPARIEGSRLVIDDIPPRSKFPVRVRVVAWQYGIDGDWQSAIPVERDLYITR